MHMVLEIDLKIFFKDRAAHQLLAPMILYRVVLFLML
jgi:hypothetical protein